MTSRSLSLSESCCRTGTACATGTSSSVGVSLLRPSVSAQVLAAHLQTRDTDSHTSFCACGWGTVPQSIQTTGIPVLYHSHRWRARASRLFRSDDLQQRAASPLYSQAVFSVFALSTPFSILIIRYLPICSFTNRSLPWCSRRNSRTTFYSACLFFFSGTLCVPISRIQR